MVESIRVAQEASFQSIDLSSEYPITLASSLKKRLIEVSQTNVAQFYLVL